MKIFGKYVLKNFNPTQEHKPCQEGPSAITIFIDILCVHPTYIRSLKFLLEVSGTDSLKDPDLRKHRYTHSWCLHYVLGISVSATSCAHVYGFPTFKTRITYRNTHSSKHTSQQLSRVWVTVQRLQVTHDPPVGKQTVGARRRGLW